MTRGDATLFVHKALEFESAGSVPAFNPTTDPEEWGVILGALAAELKQNPGVWTKIAKATAECEKWKTVLNEALAFRAASTTKIESMLREARALIAEARQDRRKPWTALTSKMRNRPVKE